MRRPSSSPDAQLVNEQLAAVPGTDRRRAKVPPPPPRRGSETDTKKITVLPPASSEPAAPSTQRAALPLPAPIATGQGHARHPALHLPVGLQAPDEPTIAEARGGGEPAASPPTLRPSASTVRPPPRRVRPATLVAGFFWGSLAVAFGASSAAVWWELYVEPGELSAQRSATERFTPLPGGESWLGGAKPAQPALQTSAARSPGAKLTGDVDGSSESNSGDSAHDAADTTGESVSACARRYFAAGSFSADHDLGYVCDDTDLRNVKERIHLDVVRHADGTKTDGLVSWGTLGWYQLPLVATVRHACCTEGERASRLPQQHGPCDGLATSIDALATSAANRGGRASPGTSGSNPQTTTPQTTDDVSDKGREFAGRVQCLHREGRVDAFGYTFRPSQPNREEFERLVCDAGPPPG